MYSLSGNKNSAQHGQGLIVESGRGGDSIKSPRGGNMGKYGEGYSEVVRRMDRDRIRRECVLGNLLSLRTALDAYQEEFDHLRVIGDSIRIYRHKGGFIVAGFSDRLINRSVNLALSKVCPTYHELGYREFVSVLEAAIAVVRRSKKKLAL